MKRRSVVNAPGRASLAYRVATRESLMALMNEAASAPDIVRTDLANPIRLLPMIPEEGFIPALFDAWATTGDVLTFYQERIANEGYLRTATEALSQRELIRTLGHAPMPALSAQGVFAFTMATAKGAPDEAIVPASTPIAAAPPPDGSPAPVFETFEDVRARGEWNAVPLVFPPATPAASSGATYAIRVTGDDLTVLKPGAPMILRRREGGTISDTVVTLLDVAPDAVTKTALVRWAEPVSLAEGSLELVAFRTSVGLFGANAPDWSTVLPAIKARYATRPGGAFVSEDGTAWTPLGGAPNADVIALRYGDGTLYGLTAGAVLRAGGSAWTAFDPKAKGDLTALATAGGAVYAGSSRGEVFVSYDGAASWTAIGTSPAPPAAPGTPPLPPVPIRALAVRAGDARAPAIFAGTERGLAAATDDGSPWTFANAGLGGIANDAQPAPVAIVALALRGTTLLAATSAGLFTRELGTPASTTAASTAATGKAATAIVASGTAPTWTGPWKALALPGVPDRAPFAAVAFGDAGAFAASGQGLFRGDAALTTWTRIADASVAAAPAALDAAGSSVIVSSPHGAALSHDAGATWQPAAAPATAPAMAAALDAGSKAAAFAVPLGEFPTDWPAMPLGSDGLDLERLVPALASDAQIALVDTAAPAPPAQAARVTSAHTVRNTGQFPQSALVTHIELTPLDEGVTPASFGRRTTRVYYDARTFGVAPDPAPAVQAVGGTAVLIDAATTPFPAQRIVAVTGRPIRARVVGLAGGVRRVEPGPSAAGSHWGLRGLDCRSIAAAPDGTVYVGTTQGVWRRPPGGDFAPWPQPTDGEPPAPLLVMRSIAATNALVAGVAVGLDETIHTGRLYVAAADATTWSAPSGMDAVAVARVLAPADGGTTWWAGTTAGVWRSDDGLAWRACGEPGAPDASRGTVTALAWDADGKTLVCGSTDGIAVRTPDGAWQRRVNGLANRDVLSLAVGGGAWWAGTDGGGVFTSPAGGASWTQVDLALAPGSHSVRAVAYDGALYAAVRGFGVLRDGARVDAGIANDVRGLVVRADGVLAAARSGTVLATSSFVPQQIVLQELGAIESRYAAYLDRGTIPVELRTTFTTQLKLPLPPKAVVRTLPPPGDDANAQGGAASAPVTWIVSADGMEDLLLRLDPVGATIVVSVVRSFVVMKPPDPSADAPQATWTLQADGGEGAFVARPGEVEYAAAADDDDDVGEVVTVTSTALQRDASATEVAFAPALARVYDGSTVQLAGNCARGSHGASGAMYEALGNGDASKANQEFTLTRRALSVLQSADGTLDPQISVMVRPSVPRSAITATAALRVDDAEAAGVPWRYVESLANQGPEDRVFELRFDGDVTTVVFGDGAHGSRLPTGQENVVANYRVGNGPSGNIPAGATLMLRKRSGGVLRVSNPVPATGGIAAEAMSDATAAAQAGLRSLQRVVSLADLEDFALARSGIAKAKVRTVGATAQLTLAGPGATTVDPSVKDALLAAIHGNGGAAMRVTPVDARPRYVRVDARLHVAKHADAATIAAVAAARLRSALAFENRALGDDLAAARVVELLQDAPGVLAVTLNAFHVTGTSPMIAPVIRGTDARSATDGELIVLLDPDPAATAIGAGT